MTTMTTMMNIVQKVKKMNLRKMMMKNTNLKTTSQILVKNKIISSTFGYTLGFMNEIALSLRLWGSKYCVLFFSVSHLATKGSRGKKDSQKVVSSGKLKLQTKN